MAQLRPPFYPTPCHPTPMLGLFTSLTAWPGFLVLSCVCRGGKKAVSYGEDTVLFFDWLLDPGAVMIETSDFRGLLEVWTSWSYRLVGLPKWWQRSVLDLQLWPPPVPAHTFVCPENTFSPTQPVLKQRKFFRRKGCPTQIDSSEILSRYNWSWQPSIFDCCQSYLPKTTWLSFLKARNSPVCRLCPEHLQCLRPLSSSFLSKASQAFLHYRICTVHSS